MKIKDVKIYRSKNIYSLSPVIKIIVDLEGLAGVETKEIAGFNEGLLALLPGLEEHHCSKGRKGGFIERLREGTYFGHTLEHISLELQAMAGYPVFYGKTRSTDVPGVYEVIMEYDLPEVAQEAFKQALQLAEKLCRGAAIDISTVSKQVKSAAKLSEYGPSSLAIAKAAQRKKVPVNFAGNGFLQLGYGKYKVMLGATITQNTSCLAVDIVGDKQFTKELLRERGLPVPIGYIVTTEEEARQEAERIGFPVTVKPRVGNHGKGVTVNCCTSEAVIDAFERARKVKQEVIVERYIQGQQYRLLVIAGKLVAASQRKPPVVIGDGKSSVNELIANLNDNSLRGEGHELPLTQVKLDHVVIGNLQQQGLSLDSILPLGKPAFLHYHANISQGATAIDVTDQVHPETAEMVCRAVQIVGLDIAGVDLVIPDIRISLKEMGAIIEINAAPGIRMHHYPAEGLSRDVGGEIVDYLFPTGKKARIPIVAVTGTNGKTTTTRMLGRIIALGNRCVGMTTTDGIYIDGKLVVKGDTTGPRSAQVVLSDTKVEVAVLETARGGLIRGGLGYDWSDVGIITNISEDHIGQDGIEDLTDLAMIKALVGEAVIPGGQVVLNADDPKVCELAARFNRQIIYFSSIAKNPVIKRHLGAGGKAVFVLDNWLVYAQGHIMQKIIRVEEIPATLKGTAQHNVQNALAASAGAIGLGISLAQIKDGLKEFTCTLEANPGRQNFLAANGIDILVDYGHNVAAFYNTIETLRKSNYQRLIGIAGVPGDRSDETIYKAGKVLGKGFDYLIIKEDKDLRGRPVGEVAKLLDAGANEVRGSKQVPIIILDEGKAVRTGLKIAQPGDVVVIFYEKLEVVLSEIEKFKIKNTEYPAESTDKHVIG